VGQYFSTDGSDALSIELFHSAGVGPLTHTFNGENYASAPISALTRTDPGERYLAQSGKLTISANDPSVGGAFTGSITDISFAEVTIDASFISKVIPGGEVWCVASHEFDMVWAAP
jgi:hypothetical protein